MLQSTAESASLPASRPEEVALFRIDVGTFSPPVVLDLAGSTGLLDAAGLEVTEHAVASSPAQFRSLVDGDLQVALTSPDNVLAYRFDPGNPLGERLDARVVGAVDRALGLGLYARPGLTADDLRGARVGVDVPHSGFALALYALADRLGVRREEYETVSLGSTPKRLRALLAGECDATMLNAGNELLAEAAGCVRLAGVSDHLAPYLGTVVAVVGDKHLEPARLLADALAETCAEILAGRLDVEATEAAARRLELDDTLARRYVDRLRSPTEGVVADGVADRASLQTLVRLRSSWLPATVDGRDAMAGALAEDSGLVDRR
ncbi:MAG: ABC transporter substrate-binding protein [Nocardioidaceae bacterium]|nr:ABC transporter substrate-binding protein [Nocardioidaceae bacterium]NUS52050.1 ABC transporter substrate-binding protein [Nocardioidaceae bacterium]